MGGSDGKAPVALGFLTVLEQEQGLIGGYLILNAGGRPLEFHCTVPVKANRAQQILYGPTLDPYLYGEQIGQTLIGKGALQPVLVCTDLALVLSVREYVAVPVALVLQNADSAPASPNGAGQKTYRVDATHGSGANFVRFHVGSNHLALDAARQSDRQQITEKLADAAAFDFSEPFERIREAVQEAHKSGR